MAIQEKKQRENRLKDKYRLVIYNDNTLREFGFMRLTGFNLLSVIGFLTVALVTIVFLLVSYTSIREFIPGYPDSNFRRTMVRNAILLDSLENELRVRDQYFSNIIDIVNGRDSIDTDTSVATELKTKNVNFEKSEKDIEFVKQVEAEEQFNISLTETNYSQPESKLDIGLSLFFSPIRGVISQQFNPDANHYGTDMVAKANEVIKSVLDGTVVLSTWTLETGYVIAIQHDNNFVSFYKHNSELLKNVGTHVHAGEAIAIIGNSGELSSGPHLHFELWHKGLPVNPEEYIKF